MSPTDLVAKYRALPFPSHQLGDCAENYLKCQIVNALAEQANELEVSQLLLDILRTPGELDLVRMDAAKIVALDIDGSAPLGGELKRQLWTIVADSSDDLLVRQVAAQCLEFGYGGEREVALIERILFDDAEDLDVRHGVLVYLKDPRAGELTARLLPRLRSHAYWGQFESALEKLSSSY